MRTVIFVIVTCALFLLPIEAQENKYSTFYYQRATLFEELPVTPDDIIFLGNSITNGAEWAELLDNSHVKNRGISGDVCMGVYDRLSPILRGKPAKIFLMIGINDVSAGLPADTIVGRIEKIVQKIRCDSPTTKLSLQSLLPVTNYYKKFGSHTSHPEIVPVINAGIKEIADREGVVYIDLYNGFVDSETGKMKIEYTNDGLHLLGKGYLKWIEIIKPYLGRK